MYYEHLLEKHIEELERILIAFAMDSPAAIRMLEDEKRALALRHDQEGEDWAKSLCEPACYNALAAIRTAIEQEKINPQLTACVKDAKDELCDILAYMKEFSEKDAEI